MAPLLPSESSAYTVSFPQDAEDDRFNLKVRTGAASAYTSSTIVAYGGLIVGLQLPIVSIPVIEAGLIEKGLTDWSELLSNELFYLHIITRKWTRVDLEPNALKPAPRLFHSLTFDRDTIYVFGGLVLNQFGDGFVAVNDLWEFNITRREWVCIDDGTESNVESRYGATLKYSSICSPVHNTSYRSLLIIGGRNSANKELSSIDAFDLEDNEYFNNEELDLSLNELIHTRKSSAFSSLDPKATSKESSRLSLKCLIEDNFVAIDNSNGRNQEGKSDVLYLYSHDSSKTANDPLVSIPIAPNATGLRLTCSLKNIASIPKSLKYPSGGIFGSNIIVSGISNETNQYQVFLYNRPAEKWTRLNIDTKKSAAKFNLWKCFGWPSHHKVLLLGSIITPSDHRIIYPTIQKFDLLVTVGLPITNIFHAFSKTENSREVKPTSLRETSFEAYSKYVAPNTKISSIRSCFPNYAVTLGRNAFERYGSSLSDFELISADGDKISVPLMILRKRWGRCFDMLLAKAYARAVYQLESAELEEDDAELNSISSGSSNINNKKSMKVLNKAATTAADRDVPQFRHPFQDNSGSNANRLTSTTLASSSGSASRPTSRKTSAISHTESITSATTNSSSAPGSSGLSFNLGDIPPPTEPPTEPLPTLEKSSNLTTGGLTPLLKTALSREYIKDSPRGSISGSSMRTSNSHGFNQTASGPPVPTIKLKDLRSPANNGKRSAGVTLTPSTQTADSPGDASSLADSNIVDADEAVTIEPLLIPRSLYLPFATNTVSAVAEFFFTGQVGDKWLLTPTTTDTFLIAKFYEIPLLYDLILEALYAIIGKKEDSLIKEYGKLLDYYNSKLKEIFKDDNAKVQHFFLENPNIKESFDEIESALHTVDDGYLNLGSLRKASKAFTISTVNSHKHSVVSSSRRRQSAKSSNNGKSRLSSEAESKSVEKEYEEPLKSGPDGKPEHDAEEEEEEEDDDDEEEEGEEEEEEEEGNGQDVEAQDQQDNLGKSSTLLSNKKQAQEETINFKTNTISSQTVHAKNIDDENIDSISPLAKRFIRPSDPEASKQSGSDEPLDTTKGNSSRIGGSELNIEEDVNQGSKQLSDDNIDPLTKVSSKGSKSTSSEADAIQVPEGRFVLPKGNMNKLKSDEDSSSEAEQKKTSDSDDMAVGLGLVSDLKLDNEKDQKNNDNDDGITGFDENNDSNLPILVNLASPDSPAPSDYLVQIVYETAALACEMKLLLRAMNALEMSKLLKSKEKDLLTGLEEYKVKYEQEQAKVAVQLEAQAKELREREKFEKKDQRQKFLNEESVKYQRVREERIKRSQQEILRKDQFKQSVDDLHDSEATPIEATASRANAALRQGSGSIKLDERSSIRTDSTKDDTSVFIGGKSIRSALNSFRSLSSFSNKSSKVSQRSSDSSVSSVHRQTAVAAAAAAAKRSPSSQKVSPRSVRGAGTAPRRHKVKATPPKRIPAAPVRSRTTQDGSPRNEDEDSAEGRSRKSFFGFFFKSKL